MPTPYTSLAGDGSAYWVGHSSQREILSTWPLTNYPRVVAQSGVRLAIALRRPVIRCLPRIRMFAGPLAPFTCG